MHEEAAGSGPPLSLTRRDFGRVTGGALAGSALTITDSPASVWGRVGAESTPHEDPVGIGRGESGPPHLLAWGGSAGSSFFGGKGFERNAHKNVFDSVLDLHVDTWWSTQLDFWRGSPMQNPEQGGWIGETEAPEWYLEAVDTYGYRSMIGWGPSFETYGTQGAPIDWYQSLPESEKFERPGGGTVEDLTELIRVNVNDEPIVQHREADGEDYLKYYPSIHAPGFQRYLSELASDIGQLGIHGLWIDNTYNWQNQRDTSVWASAAFRDHLRDLPAGELERLGIDDVDAFDLQAELQSRVPPGETVPATDPVYREYVKLDYQRFRATFENVRESMTSELGGDDEAALLANLNFIMPGRMAVATEEMTTAATEYQRSFPPDHIYDFVPKLLLAAGRFEKSGFPLGSPVQIPRVIDAVESSALDLTQVQPGLLSTLFAEQLSNRCVGSAHFFGDCCYGTIQEQPMNWLRADGTLPEELSVLTGFARSVEELLRGGRFAHDTAVVMSIPSSMWAHAPSWGLTNRERTDSFMGAADLVRETGHPYDVLLFGHPDVWDDADMLARLDSYDQVVLPAITCISEGQRTALLQALDDGLSVVVTDGVPERDADYQPLPVGERDALLDHENTTVVSGTPALDHRNDDGDGSALQAALDDTPTVALSTRRPTSVTLQTQDDPGRVVVQIVNYDLEHRSGAVQPLTDLSVTVRGSFPFDVTNARLYRPGQSPEAITVEATAEGHLDLNLPETGPWGILVLGPSPEAVSLAGSESSASDALTAAETAVNRAREAGRTGSLATAETLLSYAGTASEYGAYALATETAARAERVATTSLGQPTVGVDTDHGQAEVGFGIDSFLEFAPVVEAEFTTVENWSAETFASLDVLLVPPVFGDDGEQFGFTDREAALVEAFVEQGGGLVFLGGAGIADDHAALLDQFGFGFEGPAPRHGPVFRDAFTPLTRRAPDISAVGVPTTVTVEEEATVLYRFPNDAPDAGGDPICAIAEHGDGHVVAYGDTRAFERPDPDRFHSTFFRQTFADLGEHAARSKLEKGGFDLGADQSSETPVEPTESKVEPSETKTDTTATPGQSGFGIAATIGAIGGLSALIRWFKNED